ncbi:hypothetical protein DPMN_125324 [Dreissena polymorpha]|uniref:Uncharacterized protein n=1 Tax=Dreissena polymorpha TaxID=45954 RepID=A0A9D4JX27_DREPO|nr:hypothetical protein DPMN_125324 [Dreissena polymorpha]
MTKTDGFVFLFQSDVIKDGNSCMLTAETERPCTSQGDPNSRHAGGRRSQNIRSLLGPSWLPDKRPKYPDDPE